MLQCEKEWKEIKVPWICIFESDFFGNILLIWVDSQAWISKLTPKLDNFEIWHPHVTHRFSKMVWCIWRTSIVLISSQRVYLYLSLPSIWKLLSLPHNFCCCRSAMWERMEGDQGSSDLHIWVRFFQLFRDAIDLSTDLTSRLFYTSLLTLYFQWQGRCFEIESGFNKDILFLV